MELNKLISELSKILDRYGNMNVIIHDSADGSDYVGMSTYVDLVDGILNNECVIGFDSDIDIR